MPSGAWAGEWGHVVHSLGQYRTPSFTGDATFLNGDVTSKAIDAEGRGIVTVSAALTNQDDVVLAKGTIEVMLPRD